MWSWTNALFLPLTVLLALCRLVVNHMASVVLVLYMVIAGGYILFTNPTSAAALHSFCIVNCNRQMYFCNYMKVKIKWSQRTLLSQSKKQTADIWDGLRSFRVFTCKLQLVSITLKLMKKHIETINECVMAIFVLSKTTSSNKFDNIHTCFSPTSS